MEELIPFVFFILWFLFGGVFGKGKREEARRKAEAAREAQKQARRARVEEQRELREARGQLTTEERGPPRGFEATTTTSQDTSIDMIPDELWDILTGGAPRPTRAPYPSAERESVPDGGWVTSPPYDEEDAVHSIEGVSAEEIGGEVVDYDDDAERTARARYEDIRATSWDDRAGGREATAVRTNETSEVRHDEFHNRLLQGEIGAGAAAPRPAAKARLGLNTMDDVRRAIVLAEILGPPKALR